MVRHRLCVSTLLCAVAHLLFFSLPAKVSELHAEHRSALTSSEARKRCADLAQMVASRVHHSKAYLAFYLVMAVLNTTLVFWILLSRHGHPTSIAFLGLELLITVVLCAEIFVRLIATGRVRWLVDRCTAPWRAARCSSAALRSPPASTPRLAVSPFSLALPSLSLARRTRNFFEAS